MGWQERLFGRSNRRQVNDAVDQVEDGVHGVLRGLGGLHRGGPQAPPQKSCPNCGHFAAPSDPMCSNCRFRFR